MSILLIESVRAVQVDRYYSQVITTHGLYGQMALKHDGLIVGLFVLFHLAGWSIGVRPLSSLLRLIAASILTLCMVDLFVFAQFAQRLRIDDFVLFGQEGHAILDIVGGFVGDPKNLPVTAAIALTFLSLLAAWPAPARLRTRSVVLASLLALLWIGVSCWPDRTTYVNDWAYRNLVEIQTRSGAKTPYGAATIEAARRWSETHYDAPHCVPGLNSRRNVILVLMESLSSHHSNYLSGLSDWTPQIDKIARRNHVWTNFYANGNNTAYGYVAAITGHDPLTAPNETKFLRWQRNADALPFRLKQAGYRSAFLTSGDLGFLGSGAWLKNIGFDFVEGHDAPFYRGMERFNFQAAPDGALYDRSLQWIQHEAGPFFLLVNTESTHQPYMNPVTHERSQESAFRYADEMFGKFVNALSAQGYFAHGGVLLLTGDHHDMVMLGLDEVRRYGNAADAQIPLLVIGEKLQLPGRIGGAFQQADIPPSIEYLAGERACFTERQRNLFQPDASEPPRCILHMRGDRRDVIDVFCGHQFGQIRIDGDATQVIDGAIPNAQALIQEINAERVGWFMRRQPDNSILRSLPGEANRPPTKSRRP